jgi:hypothetical protein
MYESPLSRLHDPHISLGLIALLGKSLRVTFFYVFNAIHFLAKLQFIDSEA